MIKPIYRGEEYLEFECDECGDIFHHAIKISHDASEQTDTQKYDIRNWVIMRIHLQCPNPKCKTDEVSLKLSIREDLAKKAK